MKRLEGRNAVITGGANGIGLGCALRCVAEGASVALIDIEQDALAEACRQIEEAGGSVSTHAVDCTDRAAVTELIARLRRDSGPIDIVINTVGLRVGEQ